MPKGRMLNKSISNDEEVAKLSIETALLYTWCISHLDIEGRISGESVILKGIVVPYLDYLTIPKIDKCVEELKNSPLVVVYGSSKRYIQFVGFTKNQKLQRDKEAPTEFPEPTPELLQSYSRETLAKVKGSKEKVSSETPPPATEPPKKLFLDFVRLSEAEYAKLVEQFSETGVKERIARLNDYIGSKGVKYKSHYYTILTWARKDEPIKSKQPIQKL